MAQTKNHWLGFDTHTMKEYGCHILCDGYMAIVHEHIVGEQLKLAVAFNYAEYQAGNFTIEKLNYQSDIDVIKAYERFNVCMNPETIALHLNIDETIIN